MRTLSNLILGFTLCFGSAFAASNCTLLASGGDDGPSLLKAVQSCSTITIPKSTTLNIESRLNMTGVADKHIKLEGTIKFSSNITYWTQNAFYIPFQTQITYWLLGGKRISLNGGGTIDGSGQVWYDAFATNSSLLRPIILTIYKAKGVAIENITLLNSPEWNNLVNEGEDILYRHINISSLSTSVNPAKNTDGWDTYRSTNVSILDSVIVNDDDCVSLKPNSTKIRVENLDCTGSHGISVGSLGQYAGEYDIVEDVIARNVKMSNAQNGARIKAWAGPNVGSGIVKNIRFENFIESAVQNPVVIDQCYMTNATLCAQYPSNTYIEDVLFTNITGTGTESVVASLSCSPDGRCSNITVSNLHLTYPSGSAQYSCQNVNVTGNAASLFSCTST
ncbi:glycoside hydrolase family 28 protein [Crepidotus variabilis]|uniref:galacturonan 1,4-alpha-galacturonidase n=1 Tax=Crepidotus variabilis TaxID=179855 RepID=A0A9P6JRH3_9AGAR|nr:glycoside hydrolase family 28 protein [Crepidotus variabilis]